MEKAENTKNDTLVVLWSSGDRDVAEKSCLMYTHAAKKYGWFSEVILIIWGPSAKLCIEDEAIKAKVQSMQQDGVILEACVACSNMLGVTDELKKLGVDVKGMGTPLTNYLKADYKVLSY
ncbi:MAG: DsrE family protein [Bacteroidales bacterium]|nr:DsrE family protein [Bacteroidales bacterium]